MKTFFKEAHHYSVENGNSSLNARGQLCRQCFTLRLYC